MANTKIKVTKAKLSATQKLWRLALCIAVPLGGGFLISMLTRDAMGQFEAFKQPPLAPPAWLFPVAWTILYILMGVAGFLIFLAGKNGKKTEQQTAKTVLVIYGIQLVLNFMWTPIFFNARQFWLAFAVLAAMWLAEIAILAKTYKLSKPAFCCLIPYILWTTFAAYLNIAIAILN